MTAKKPVAKKPEAHEIPKGATVIKGVGYVVETADKKVAGFFLDGRKAFSSPRSTAEAAEARLRVKHERRGK